jgi:hypothetical protein
VRYDLYRWKRHQIDMESCLNRNAHFTVYFVEKTYAVDTYLVCAIREFFHKTGNTFRRIGVEGIHVNNAARACWLLTLVTSLSRFAGWMSAAAAAADSFVRLVGLLHICAGFSRSLGTTWSRGTVSAKVEYARRCFALITPNHIRATAQARWFEV